MDTTIGIITGTIVGPVVLAIISAFGILFKKVLTLQEEKAVLQAQIAYLNGEVVRLSARVEELQAKHSNGEEAETAVVVTDDAGMIVDWNAGATILVKHRQRDMLGKHISVLVPKKDIEMHRALWAKFISENRPPRRGPFDIAVLNADGVEVPCSSVLSSYQEHGQTRVKAIFRRRVGAPLGVTAEP